MQLWNVYLHAVVTSFAHGLHVHGSGYESERVTDSTVFLSRSERV